MVMFVGANYLAAELDPRHWRGVVIIKRGTLPGPLAQQTRSPKWGIRRLNNRGPQDPGSVPKVPGTVPRNTGQLPRVW